MPVLNLSKVPENAYEPIPAGIYQLEVVEADEREGKESGKPYLNVQFAVPADADEYANRRVFCKMTYEEEKAFMLVGFLRALGYTDSELEAFEINEEFLEEIVGTEVTAQVKVTPAKDGYDAKNDIKKFIYTVPAAEASDNEAF
jgi:hypothetical protein